MHLSCRNFLEARLRDQGLPLVAMMRKFLPELKEVTERIKWQHASRTTPLRHNESPLHFVSDFSM